MESYIPTRLILFLFVHSAFGKHPNIVVLLTDDLGINDLPSYGSQINKAENIERIFTEGARFTTLMSGAALCTPSRSSFLTGRYAFRYGMGEAENGPPVIVYAGSRVGLPENETTWASFAQDNGYSTLAVGKWHVGWSHNFWSDQRHGPLKHGFDHFYGLPFTLVVGFEKNESFFKLSSSLSKCSVGLLALIMTILIRMKKPLHIPFLIFTFFIFWFFFEHFYIFHPLTWWKRSFFMEKYLNSYLTSDNQVVERPIDLENLAERLTNESISFIKRKKDGPFLLYHAFSNVHTPYVVNKRFCEEDNEYSLSDSIREMDFQVGRILKALDELDLSKNTIVFFASDHGGLGSNYPYRAGKGAAGLEGGIRIAGGIRWPGKIPNGSVIKRPTSLMDFFPTIIDIIGSKSPPKELDGRSFYKSLSNPDFNEGFRIFRHYCGSTIHSLRMVSNEGSMLKAHYAELLLDDEDKCPFGICFCQSAEILPKDNPKIVDINTDPGERNPIDVSRKLKSVFLSEYESAAGEFVPPAQLNSFFNVMPILPWLQP